MRLGTNYSLSSKMCSNFSKCCVVCLGTKKASCSQVRDLLKYSLEKPKCPSLTCFNVLAIALSKMLAYAPRVMQE